MSGKDQTGSWLTLDENTELVNEPLRIQNLLKSVLDAHALVTISIPERAEVYNSAVLDIDADKGELKLDELTPDEGHRHLLAARHLSAFARIKGVGLYFEAPLLEVGVEDNIAYYRIKLPELVFYGQKRSHYRVRVGLSAHAGVTLGNADKHIAEGELRDISAGGIGASFAASTPLNIGDVIADCLIELPGGGALHCSLEVRYAKHDTAHHTLHLGACFIGLKPAEERLIRRCVSNLEREALRKQPR